jgi:hypothetical protein
MLCARIQRLQSNAGVCAKCGRLSDDCGEYELNNYLTHICSKLGEHLRHTGTDVVFQGGVPARISCDI